MSKRFFDYDDGDFAMSISDNMAIDTDGDLMMRMGDNMAMDMDSGDIHFISGWSNDDEDDDYFKNLDESELKIYKDILKKN